MGNVSDRATPSPQAIERRLPWGPVLRGFRWGNGPDVALLLHEPGADLDAWATLPVEIARQLEIETVALDLPGHGLSDDPWEPARLPDLLRNLPDIAPAAGRRFLIAAGDSAIAALEQAPAIELSGSGLPFAAESWMTAGIRRAHRACPSSSSPDRWLGAISNDARRLATACGGWAVVTSLPVAERGTGLLASSVGRSPRRGDRRLSSRLPAPPGSATHRPVAPGTDRPAPRPSALCLGRARYGGEGVRYEGSRARYPQGG